MAHMEGEIIISRPAEDVFDFVADERNRYDPRVRRAEKLTSGPIGVGTRFRSESTSMGRPVHMVIEITAYERPSRLGSSTHLSAMEIHSTLTFESVTEGTRMRWSSDLEPRGLLRLTGPLVARMGRRQAEDIWAGLKRVLEGGPVKDAAWRRGPGAFFVRHPVLYRVSLASAIAAMVAFADRTRRSPRGWRRLGWGALTLLQSAQILGIWWGHREAGASGRSEVLPARH